MALEFEWHERKAGANRRKHGVSFEERRRFLGIVYRGRSRMRGIAERGRNVWGCGHIFWQTSILSQKTRFCCFVGMPVETSLCKGFRGLVQSICQKRWPHPTSGDDGDVVSREVAGRGTLGGGGEDSVDQCKAGDGP